MERHDLLALMARLKLAGMRAAYDDIMRDGLKRQRSVQQILGDLLSAEVAEKEARSISYQIGAAKLPLAKELTEFTFTGSPVNEALVRDLHGGGFLETQRNIVFVGGTGTGKSHLSIAITANCIRKRNARARFFNVVDLVNRLEAEARAGVAGRLAEQLTRVDLVVLDELGYLPFAQSGGQLLKLMAAEGPTRAQESRRAYADRSGPAAGPGQQNSWPQAGYSKPATASWSPSGPKAREQNR